ncbi:MAG TPA: M48 family metalloprotease [Burkholderiaceae bacterium]
MKTTGSCSMLLLFAALLAPPARALPIDFERTGLAWSSAEVSDAGDGALRTVLDKAGRRDALGCRALCGRIERVWLQLLAVLPPAQSSGLQLHVVRLDDEDAFAVPSGDVLLSENFIQARELDNAQLAFVLAHELSHVLLQHERQTLTAALSLLPRAVPRSVQDVYVELEFNHRLLKALEPVYQQAEFEADETGLQLAALAGFSPDAQLEFLVGQAHEPDRELIVRTHGSAAARLAAARATLPLARRLYESVSP